MQQMEEMNAIFRGVPSIIGVIPERIQDCSINMRFVTKYDPSSMLSGRLRHTGRCKSSPLSYGSSNFTGLALSCFL